MAPSRWAEPSPTNRVLEGWVHRCQTSGRGLRVAALAIFLVGCGESNLAGGSAPRPKIIVVGDSLAISHDGQTPPTWPAQLGEELRNEVDSVESLAFPGATSGSWHPKNARWEREVQPLLEGDWWVVVQWGSNDAALEVNPVRLMFNGIAQARRAFSMGAGLAFFLTPPHFNPANSLTVEYRARMLDMCEQDWRIVCVDLQSLLNGDHNDDGIHFNDAGHAFVTEVVAEHLRCSCNPNRPTH